MQTELSLATVTATQEQVDALWRGLLPAQGQWSEAAYLRLTDHTTRLVDKRGAYAEAQIPAYWIVSPQSETITVFYLEGPAYVEHGVFGRSATATSVVLEGFSIVVDAVFDAE
jgi:hypothetical protein